ncbi:semaphorin-6D-like [Cottoperca gobio]|uniref:Semaphorin-6D-like n=1 Tax=Cottoperca gobio TaxID=56716 RepID=A0A6J2QJZ4_COTGO|nr:semaphorin-6D-like [Cottoperca gobio]XP_029298727.1 semaphorin-6D-like [Cottoperca gobio]XP_029298728.1 semaphorin-6D-like [Cottoperca gobio]XP_029298730.1 semaphorin-6D-like [Cottoperca gobio]
MAPTNWLAPWRRQPLMLLPLLLILTSCFLSESASTTPFPKDLEPINTVNSEQSYQFPGFQGLLQDNDTLRLGLDFQRLLRINHMLYIAARDHVFAVNLTTASEEFVPQLKLTWRSKDVSKCTVRGKNSDECYNYVKVLVPRNDETLFACGTNAFNPTCRNYKMTSLEQVGEEVVGQARCPFESGQSNVGLFAGGDFYSATMTDFLASDAVIYRSLGDGRPVLRTVKYDSKWLREPHFLHAIDYGNYVYFFLSEIAVEYTALGKVVFSRVARVCKNDNGGSPRVLERYWTSFLKARLNCSVPGDSFFYFDVLQSLTNVLQINQRPTVVGVFTTQDNSIPGSAVCAFYMDDIEKVFNGKFKEQRTSDSSWTPVPDEQVPRPRPGTCAGDSPAADYKSSVQFPDDTLTFIKSYPLMDEAVPSVNDRPCFTRTSSRSKLTQIVVDVSAGPYKDRTVMFLGSDDGRVLKVLASTHPNNSFGSKLLEDIDVYNPSKCNVQGQEDRRVLGLELDKDRHALFVAFTSCVIRVLLSRCTQHGACQRACLASRDPYCIWLRTGSCANMAPGFKAGFEQDIEGDRLFHKDSCHADVLATTRNQDSAADSAYGVRRLPEMDQHAGANVHYTLLIACVLVAFFLGAILSGFLVSLYCSRSAAQRARRLGKDPEASLPHALSLRSLAKLNRLLDGQPKQEDKLDMSTPKMYSSFIPNGLAEPQLHTPGHQGLLLGDPDLSLSQSLSQGDGELSGLPTPDSTPELPIKNMKALQQHQYERNQNCNNTKDSNPKSGPCCSGSSLGFMAVIGNSVTQQVFPFSHHHGNSLSNGAANGAGTSSTSLHLPEERKILNEERAASGGGGRVPHHHHSQQSLPQTVVDVSALDELLKHIHEVSASGTGGIKVLTSTSSSSLFPGPSSGGHFHNHHHHCNNNNPHGQTRTHYYNNSHLHSNNSNNISGSGYHHQQQIPEKESAPYYSTSTLPRDGLPKRLDAPTQNSTSSSASSSSSSSNNPTSSTSIPSSSSSSSSTPLQQQVIPEGPGGTSVSVTRHHSQRHSLIKMGSGGGAVPRHHSFNQRGSQQTHFLARMNTNSSSNGPPGTGGEANVNTNTHGDSQRPSIASACLTRQHSYSEGPHVQRAAIVRRTLSLKPEVPPKPLFLPNTATSAVAEAGKYY